jgi:hypothetical protein
MVLITFVILRVFADLTVITSPVTAALGIVVGLLATVVGFYNYQRRLEKGLVLPSDREPGDIRPTPYPRPWPHHNYEELEDDIHDDPEDDTWFSGR